jgi:hypothetical protein
LWVIYFIGNILYLFTLNFTPYFTMTSSIQTILEILKYTIPAIVMLIATYIIIEKFLTNDIERKRYAIFQENMKTTIPMRLQAYERLSIYCERINPGYLSSQMYNPAVSITDMQLAMIQNIRTEFEYNLSQQIYVSPEVWQTVVNATEQEIAMINGVVARIGDKATTKQFVSTINEFLVESNDDTPSKIALQSINAEAKRVLMTGS